MNQTIAKRLTALEKRPTKPKPYDRIASEERILNRLCMTREQFKLTFGSFQKWAYMKMVDDDGSPRSPIPPQYMNAKDYYFALIRQKA